MSQKGYERLQEKLGYRFSDVETLKRALTHSSFDGDKFHNNQRLEYLGDAVLQLIISDELFKVETFSEGQMTRLRSLIVREEALYAAAKEFGLGNMLILGKGEELSGGRDKPSILADAMEAVIGAVYFDGGLEAAKEAVLLLMDNAIESALMAETDVDDKTLLQLLCATTFGEDVHYETIASEGPPHRRLFTVLAKVGERKLATGHGYSKKRGEMEAAHRSLALLKEQGIG